MKKYSLGMLKPDAIERGLEQKIYTDIESSGLHIIEKRRLKLTPDDVRVLYEESQQQSYYSDIVSYITRNVVEIFIVQGEDALNRLNDVVGSLNSEGFSLRRKYGRSVLENTIHSSTDNRVDIEIRHIFKESSKELFNVLLNNLNE